MEPLLMVLKMEEAGHQPRHIEAGKDSQLIVSEKVGISLLQWLGIELCQDTRDQRKGFQTLEPLERNEVLDFSSVSFVFSF